MTLKKLFLVGLVCAFLAPSSAFAEKGKWSFTPYAGANVATSRDMVESLSATAAGAVTFSDGSQIDGTVTASILGLDFDDTHNTPLLTGFDVGYFVNDNLEVFGGFEYVNASGSSVKVLDISAAGNFTDSGGTTTAISGTETANAKFEDYDSWALKVGATKYFPMQTFTTYIGGYAGFKHIDDMKFTLNFNTANVSTGKIKFYKATNTGFFGFHTGANKKFDMGSGAPAIIGIRARLDYTPELANDNSDIDLVGAGNTNNAGGGVDFGLTAQLSIPF